MMEKYCGIIILEICFANDSFELNRFKAIWDDRDSEYGEVRKYEVLYILATDNVVVKEVHGKNDGRDPYPLLLRKSKLPKVRVL